MTNINDLSQKLINSYQKKICCYDKQQWERSIEDQIMFRAENICNHSQATHSPNCTNHDRLTSCSFSGPSMTNDLIDLDLISGSAYTVKPKSQQGWLSSFGHAILRVAFFPLYLRWWCERTSAKLASLLLLLYLLQVAALRMYYHRGITLFTIQNLPAAFGNNDTSTSNYSSPSGKSSSTTTTTNNNNEFSEVPPTEVLMPIAMMFVLGVIHTQIVGAKSSSSSGSSSSSSGSSGRKSSSIRNAGHHSVSNCVKSSESLYCSNNTDHSSSSLSSSTSSSPPTSVERPRSKKRIKKDLRMRNIPKIKIHDEKNMRDIVLVHDDSVNVSEEDHSLDHSTDTLWRNASPPPFQRRYSDSKANRGKSISFTQCRRRYSESHCDQVKITGQSINAVDATKVTAEKVPKCVPISSVCKRKLLNTRPVNGMTRKLRYDAYRSHNRHLNLPPKNEHLSKNYPYYGAHGGSSYDSEGTVSPVTPIASLPGDDWPMINSDANTSGESDEENQFEKYTKPTFVSNGKPPVSVPSKATASSGYDTYQEDHHHQQQQQHGHYPKSCPVPEGTYRKSISEATQSNELKVSCSIWQANTWQKVDLSVMDLSSSIIRKVENIEHSSEYIYLGLIFSFIIAILPTVFRMQYLVTTPPSTTAQPNGIVQSSLIGSNISSTASSSSSSASSSSPPDYTDYLIQVDLFGLLNLFLDASFFFGKSFRLRFVICIAMLERFVLSLLYFFLLCVAERTFKQRFLYSKYFSQITRRDRAKRSQVPFFRLHKVSYLKVWLSVRSYLRRHGPLRSVDTICSTSFILAVCLLTCMSLQLLKDTDAFTSRLICWEMVFWSLAIGIYIMRLMILGSRINQKYRSNLSVLITEQINLHLQLERKPQKKEDLMLANHVLKLAADLIKELEAPYKISGFSANPYLYNITKVVVLSAFSAVLTEMLGFKLKLDKINLIK